jgi:hypothetical protein
MEIGNNPDVAAMKASAEAAANELLPKTILAAPSGVVITSESNSSAVRNDLIHDHKVEAIAAAHANSEQPNPLANTTEFTLGPQGRPLHDGDSNR